MNSSDAEEFNRLRKQEERLTTRIARLTIERDAYRKALRKADPRKAAELATEFSAEAQ